LAQYGIPELDYDEEKGRIEMKSLYTGGAIAKLKSVMTKLISTFEFGKKEQRAWDLFQETITLAKKWEKGNSLSFLKQEEVAEFNHRVDLLFAALSEVPAFDESITPYIHLLTGHTKEILEREKNLQKWVSLLLKINK